MIDIPVKDNPKRRNWGARIYTRSQIEKMGRSIYEDCVIWLSTYCKGKKLEMYVFRDDLGDLSNWVNDDFKDFISQK